MNFSSTTRRCVTHSVGGGRSLICHSQVDFDSLVARSEGEQRRHEEEERRTRLLIEQRLATVQKEIKGTCPQIEKKLHMYVMFQQCSLHYRVFINKWSNS